MRASAQPLIQEIPVSGPESGPYSITAGPDGALWFTMVHAGTIARLTVDGHVDRYQLANPHSGPSVITPGPAVSPPTVRSPSLRSLRAKPCRP
jgi:streptogramin lyase